MSKIRLGKNEALSAMPELRARERGIASRGTSSEKKSWLSGAKGETMIESKQNEGHIFREGWHWGGVRRWSKNHNNSAEGEECGELRGGNHESREAA